MKHKPTLSVSPSHCILALLMGSASIGSAAVISNFDFTGPPWTAQKESDFATFAANAPSVDTDLNSTTSILSNSGHTGGGYASFYVRDVDGGTVGVADGGDFEIFSSSDTPGVGMNVGNSNATTPTNFVAFNVTPASGYQTTFESISMFTGVNGSGDAYNVQIRSWDGSSETTLGTISRTSPAAVNAPVVQDTVNFTDFTSEDAVEFRLYSYNVTAGGANGGVRFDDIVLNGNTALVPEPSSALLLALAGLGILRRRRS